MRPFIRPLALAAAFGCSASLTSISLLAPHRVHATDEMSSAAPNGAACNCPSAPNSAPDNRPWPRPKLADSSPALDTTDEAATLEALHVALSETGDGGSYVWHRRYGRISGIISPTLSFKDAQGRVCRHVVMTLTAGTHTARTEGIACRRPDKSWQLDG